MCKVALTEFYYRCIVTYCEMYYFSNAMCCVSEEVLDWYFYETLPPTEE